MKRVNIFKQTCVRQHILHQKDFHVKATRLILSTILSLPSPSLQGPSTRFITTPQTTGRSGSTKLFWFNPTFLNCPSVAERFWDIKGTSHKVISFVRFALNYRKTALPSHCPS